MAARLGVALGGGGGRGLAHLGVLRAIDEAGISIHAIAGISAGALMAAGYCLGGPSAALDAALLRSSAVLGMYRDRLRIGGGNRLGALFAEMAGAAQIEECRPMLGIAAADVQSREAFVLRAGPVVDALRASIAIPLVASPVQFGGSLLADCGRETAVLRRALRTMGADVILEVTLLMDSVADYPPSVATLLRRLLRRIDRIAPPAPAARDLLCFALDLSLRPAPSEPPADLLIAPRLPTVPALARDGLRRSRHAGYQAMRAALPRLQQLLDRTSATAVPAGG
jgi:NTE family protein